MNILKKTLCLALAAVLALALAACGRVPTDEVTTETQGETVVNRIGTPQTVAGEEGKTEYAATESDISFVYQNYNKYEDNYASISNIKIDTERISAYINGTFDAKLIRIGSRSAGMKIAVKAYDINGNIVRDSFVDVPLKGSFAGQTVEGVVFKLPYEAVRVEFTDYT